MIFFDRAINIDRNYSNAYYTRFDTWQSPPIDCHDRGRLLQQAASLYRQQGNNRDDRWAIDLLSKITQGK